MNKEHFSIGAKVHVQDGDAGQVSRVVCDPKTRKVAYLVVKFSWPFAREIAVPISLVTSALPKQVMLNLTRDALEAFPNYEVVVCKGGCAKPFLKAHARIGAAASPLPSRPTTAVRQRSVPEGAIEVHRGMRVKDSKGAILGTVEGIVSKTEGHTCRHLVLRRKGGGLHAAPVDLVAGVDGEAVRLKMDAALVGRLPVYIPERISRARFY